MTMEKKMRNDAVNMTGMVFGMLTVGSRIGMRLKQSEFMVRCECGVEKPMLRGNILKSMSCGCVARSQFFKHGKSETKLFKVWADVNRRCYSTDRVDYPRYGGRGITVCEEWRTEFQPFYDWAISNGYKEGLSIDRIDNDQGYGPENCRWATAQEQALNRRSNVVIEHNGIKLTASQWAERLGIKAETIRSRYHKNWPAERVLAKGV